MSTAARYDIKPSPSFLSKVWSCIERSLTSSSHGNTCPSFLHFLAPCNVTPHELHSGAQQGCRWSTCLTTCRSTTESTIKTRVRTMIPSCPPISHVAFSRLCQLTVCTSTRARCQMIDENLILSDLVSQTREHYSRVLSHVLSGHTQAGSAFSRSNTETLQTYVVSFELRRTTHSSSLQDVSPDSTTTPEVSSEASQSPCRWWLLCWPCRRHKSA